MSNTTITASDLRLMQSDLEYYKSICEIRQNYIEKLEASLKQAHESYHEMIIKYNNSIMERWGVA